MSLLRVCAFAKRLSRRSLFEKWDVRAPLVDRCQPRVPTRAGAVRRISATPLQLQRRNVSFVNPKRDDAKKRGQEQSQLLDVIEARIQQLQCDIVLDVRHAKPQFLKAPSSGKGVLSGHGPQGGPEKKTDNPKSGKTLKVASKSQPSRWIEKLTKEKKNKLTKQKNLQQKIQKNVKTKPTAKPKKSKSASALPGTSHKTISATLINGRGRVKLPDVIWDAVNSTKAPAVAVTTAAAHNGSKGKLKDKEEDAQANAEELAQEADAQANAEELALEEGLEKRFSQQVSKWTSHVQEGATCGDIQLNIRSYLEACVFAGDVERAHRFLLSRHKSIGRRKHLNTDIYNIIMRVWAKKGKLNQISRILILLEEASLKPNLASYCSILECMGRNPKCSPTVITGCLRQMAEDGLSVDDLFNRCVFQQDEWDMVLKAVHVVQPNYQPRLNASPEPRSSSLVHDFYTLRSDHHYPKLDFTRKDLQERFKLQLRMEQDCITTIDSVETAKPVTEHMTRMRKLLADQRAEWQTILLQALRECKMILANTNNRDYKLNLYPYLCVLEDKDYVDIMIQSIANVPPSGESLKIIAKNLGDRVFAKYSVRRKDQHQVVEKLRNIYFAYIDLLAKDTKEYDTLPSEQWRKLEADQSSGPSLQGGDTHWPYVVYVELGTLLLDLMVKNLKINSNILNSAFEKKLIPILYHMFTFRSVRQVGFIKPHPILSQMQRDAMETKLTFDSHAIPMLCPPVPWTSVKFGAYLLTPTKLMRTMVGANQHEELLEKTQNLLPILDSLNQLGNCAWIINKPLLDIIINIFNDRGSEKLDIPPPLSEAPKTPHFSTFDPASTATEKACMKKEVILAKKKCREMHSLRMDALYKLSIANHMRDKIFWFPHNMDFRGRTYPCPPHLNHLGSDFTRAVLVFAEGKPLGPKGLDWLKIHLVNLTGLKKSSSLDGRLAYANSIMEDVLDSADNPLNGKKWWMDTDEPWQALSCCMEIANALRSPDPTRFISHFPVHQDGSCNGLQHYAALGRDVIGATSVNLVPCDVPQDVYSGVAQQVEEFRKRDAAKGVRIAQVLEGVICRKVVKQTVMTVVYGVTRYGGRLQIEKRLKEIDEFPRENLWDASQYLVKMVFCALKEMFKGTREIQDWLTECARLISKSGHTVEWVTPLGMPIIQPYHRTRSHLLKSTIQHINVQISYDSREKPDTVKQKNAFPPNFIHSLDSTHMMLTSLHCYSAGLTFVSVHDCFWTHALTVDTMNKICREQFVNLHSQPILQELSNFLVQKYCVGISTKDKKKKHEEYQRLLVVLGRVPQTGDFDLHQVKDSTYFFS